MPNETPIRAGLPAAEKHALFRAAFGSMLLPAGFVYKRNRFLRVHPGAVALVVGFSAERGDRVIFTALPLAIYHGAKDRNVVREPLLAFGQELDAFLYWTRRGRWEGWREGDPIPEPAADFGTWLEEQKQAFREHVFDALDAVTSPETYLSFIDHFDHPYFKASRPWGACIQAGDFARAEQCLVEHYDARRDARAAYQKQLDSLRANADWFHADTAPVEERIREEQEAVDFYAHLLELLRHRDYAAARAAAEACVERSDAILRRDMKEFYPEPKA